MAAGRWTGTGSASSAPVRASRSAVTATSRAAVPRDPVSLRQPEALAGARAFRRSTPRSPGLTLTPLAEPLRPLATRYPSAYPHNLYGQSFHHAMADQLTTLVRRAFARDYVTVHSEVGEAGQMIGAIQKGAPDTGTTGRAYAARCSRWRPSRGWRRRRANATAWGRSC